MTLGSRLLPRVFAWLARRCWSDTRGNVAIIFAFASTALVVGTGAGLDLSRAYYARQKLSEVATLTCQFSTRPSAVDVGATALYAQAVNQFAAYALTSQNWPANSLPTGGPNGTSSSYFTATGASASSATQEPTGVAELWYKVPTSFLQIIHVNQITVHAVQNCQPPTATNPGGSSTNPPTAIAPGTILVHEGAETGKTNFYFTLPNGQIGTTPTPSQIFPATAGYQGDHGNQFYIMGYCLEIDAAGVISATDPEGNHSFELDCDNGIYTPGQSRGNSSISTKAYLTVGYYELRYNFRSRVDYANYDPTYICGSTASDVSWANDSGSGFNGQRTNQINVYLDQSLNGAPPPTHTTIDGTQQLAGSNLIDVCVHSITWIERSVKIKVTTAGSYWLSFAADGNSDSLGGQLDNIRLCAEQCPGALQDNFPAQWLAANNNGVNVTLFEDSFETPPYTAGASPSLAVNGNLATSLGTTTASLSSCYSPFGTYQTPPGWSCQYANGWATAPYNQTNFYVQGAYQGSQYIVIDGNNSYNSSATTTNRLISRPLLLDPGYYQVSYDYIANVDFALTLGSVGVICRAAPLSGYVYSAPGTYPPAAGKARFAPGIYVTDGSTEILGVFMSHGQLVSTPNVANAPWATGSNATYAAPALGAATSYTNPDGSISTTPTTPPDKVNWALYDASAVNPVLDTCAYSSSYQWVPRSVSIKITKPGVYWLTFSSNGGLADGNGPGIDDVKLTALGSPYMANPPIISLVTIPVPAPAPTTNYSNNGAFAGFYIVADPFQPPAADQ